MQHARTIAIPTLAALLLATTAACLTSTPTVSTQAAPASGASSSTALAASSAAPAGLGATIDVTGDSAGEKLAVTLVKVIASAQGSDQFNTPPAGDVFFAAQFQIVNIGTVAYSDSPDNCVVAKDAAGQSFQTDVSTIAEGVGFNGTVNLAPGDKALGYEVFDAPKGDAVTQVQYTPDSGFSSDTAQWTIG